MSVAPGQSPSPPTSVPLVERQRHLDLLRTSLDDAAGGTGRVVVIRGEAGIGRSAREDLEGCIREAITALLPTSEPRLSRSRRMSFLTDLLNGRHHSP